MKIGAIVSGGLEPERPILIGDIARSFQIAWLFGVASLEVLPWSSP